MEYMFKFCNLPDDKSSVKMVNEAASRLHYKLKGINLETLDLSDYNKKYFGSLLGNLHSNLQRYAYIHTLKQTCFFRLWRRFRYVIPPRKRMQYWNGYLQ